jgi:hypothetical protein
METDDETIRKNDNAKDDVHRVAIAGRDVQRTGLHETTMSDTQSSVAINDARTTILT